MRDPWFYVVFLAIKCVQIAAVENYIVPMLCEKNISECYQVSKKDFYFRSRAKQKIDEYSHKSGMGIAHYPRLSDIARATLTFPAHSLPHL